MRTSRATRAEARCIVLALAILAGCAKAAPPAQAPESRSTKATAEEKPGAPSTEPARSAFSSPPDVAAPPENAQRSASGVAWVVLAKGTGVDEAGPEGRVLVHYTGWTRDGRMFDSSYQRSAPTMLPLDRTVPGFRDGVASMTKGEKRRIWIPAELAYGDRPASEGAPAGQLTFDIEVLDILVTPEVPEDVAGPGSSTAVVVLPSGVAYRVLRPGTSTDRPTEASLITVHYTGWTRDGRMFDSSVNRGQPFQFRISQVIPGWAEGIQHMTVGSVYRFWIPGELAYGEKPRYASMPAGQLTFDVELIALE